MKKPSRFAANLFRSLRDDDPILADMAADAAWPFDPQPAAATDDPFAAPPAAGDGGLFGRESQAPSSTEIQPASHGYAVNSIFAPPRLREASGPLQQLHFVREQDGVVTGVQEINALLHQGWRIANAFPTGNSAVFKALVLLERHS